MSHTDHATQIAAELERSILSGRYAPGDRLPSERELSSQLGVSRGVVREALGRLTSLGLIQATVGSGTRVAAPNTRQVTLGYQRLLSQPHYQLADLAAVRLPLETTIAALAAAHHTDAHLARLVGTQTILGDPNRSLEEHIQADLDFHATLADATGNPLFQVILAPIQELLIESRRRTLGQFGAELAHRHHASILAAVQRRDADAASQTMRHHLEANYRHLSGGETNAPQSGPTTSR
jgi:GntR family transcriptional repressor for pyruvate dehydrogenase complex